MEEFLKNIKDDIDLDEELHVEGDLHVEVDRFDEAVIWGTDWTTETIARQLEKGAIDLAPNFQRRDAWTNQEKSKLIESLMLGLPVPPIILAENKQKKNTYIVIDGKQRLLSIRRFFVKGEGEEFKQLRLSGLDILGHLNGKTYTDLNKEDSSYISNLENQPIRTVVIKNWPDDAFLYTVFLRLNTGSKKLSPQELRQALIPGPFLDYLDDATANSDAIKKMLGNSEPDSRMKDIELALRYYGFTHNLSNYDGNLKKFLDETCRDINSKWKTEKENIEREFSELEKAIAFAYEIFGNDSPFSRYVDGKCNNRFNKNIFELFAFYFSNSEIRDYVKDNKEDFICEFIKMNDDSMFIDAVSGTTKDIHKMQTRFDKFWNVLNSINKMKKDLSIKRVVLYENKVAIEMRKLSDE